MRKYGLAIAAMLALAAIGGAAQLRRPMPAPTPPSVTALVAPASVAPQQSAAPMPAAESVAALPSVDVEPRIVHTVPSDAATLPSPHVTFETRDGRTAGPGASPASLRRASAAHEAAEPAALGGAAQPRGGARLSVGGRELHLFGVRAPDAHDRCPAANGTALSCADAARAALAARLAGNATVNCTMPAGQDRDPGFVCRDRAGVDLGRFLVAQGLAVADPGSSYQYQGAEDEARSRRHGLWRYR